MFKWLIHNVTPHVLLTVWWAVFGIGCLFSLQWVFMSHHAKCFDTATQRALPIWCQSSQVLVSPRWRLSERARTKSPLQQHCTMQPDWQQKGQNGASLSSGCLSGGRKRKKDSETGPYTGSTEKRTGRKQGALCLDVTRLTVKQKATLNICVGLLSSSVELPELTEPPKQHRVHNAFEYLSINIYHIYFSQTCKFLLYLNLLSK